VASITPLEAAYLEELLGYKPVRTERAFPPRIILSLMHRQGIVQRARSNEQQDNLARQLRSDEWTMRSLGCKLDMTKSTLYVWKQRGVIRTRVVKIGNTRRVVVVAGSDELERLKKLRALPVASHARKRWTRRPGDGALQSLEAGEERTQKGGSTDGEPGQAGCV
jgi:hypothetical protein